MEDYKKLYEQTQRRMKEFIKRWDGIKLSSNDLFTEELKQIVEIESEDDKIRKALISVLTSDFEKDTTIDGITVEEIVAWLEKQKTIDVLDKEEREFADNVDSYRKDMDEFYKKGYNAGKEAEKQYWLKKQGEQKHKFNIGDIISNNTVIYRVDNIVKNCIGQDCYFLVNVESEKDGTRYLKLTDSKGKTHNSGEITWLCEQVDAKFEKQGEQKPYGQRKECSYCQFNYAGECKGSCQMKRDEQNPYYSVDKTEPKFEVGDWIVQENIGVYKVIEVYEFWYEVVDNKDKDYSIGFDKEYMCHLWTIQDAKDGDILVASDESVFIYSGSTNIYAQFYIALSKYGDLNTKGGNWEDKNSVHPATKEQRDTLMKAMADGGYTFDFEKKELKEIEPKHEDETTSAIKNEEAYKIGFIDGEAHAKEEMELSWSEEDDYNLQCIIAKVVSDIQNGNVGRNEELIDWLKSLKPNKDMVEALRTEYEKGRADAISEMKSSWSEDDETNSCHLKTLFENLAKDIKYDFRVISDNDRDKYTAWLKSIKDRVHPQNHWKPSNEQIMALRWVLNHIPYDSHKEEISGLLDQIKKL